MTMRIMTISALHLAAIFFMGLAYSSVNDTVSTASLGIENPMQIVAVLPNS